MSEEKIEHSGEAAIMCCCFNTYKFKVQVEQGEKVKVKKRTSCRSYPLQYVTFMNFLLIFGIIVVVDFFLKKKGMEFSLSDHPWGIKSVQNNTSLGIKALLRFQTPFGGGFELIAAMIFALIFLPRSRFFYYMAVSGLSHVTTLQLRMTTADPRPFHLDANIEPWMCYATYGNPSDHSVAAFTCVIVVFLDLFHGTPISFSYTKDSIFHSWGLYLLYILVGLYWVITMPYSRYIAGVQSLDQILFGAAIGTHLGIFCHFVIRDHLIGFFEKIIAWQNESKGLLNFTKERSDDPENTPEDPVSKEEGLEEVSQYTLSGKAKDDREFNSCKFIMILFLIWLTVIAGGTVAYAIWSTQFHKDSTEMVIWMNNLQKHGCGKQNYDETFHTRMFLDFGLVTFHTASMAIFTQRKRIGFQLCANYQLQDGSNISQTYKVALWQVITRIIVFAMLFGIYILADRSAKAMENDPSTSFHNRYITMFETVIYPMLVIAYLLNSGAYDLFVQGIQKFCIKDPTIEK